MMDLSTIFWLCSLGISIVGTEARDQSHQLNAKECSNDNATSIPDVIYKRMLWNNSLVGTGMLYNAHEDQFLVDYAICPKDEFLEIEELGYRLKIYPNITTVSRTRKLHRIRGFKISPDALVKIATIFSDPEQEGIWLFPALVNETTIQLSFVLSFTMSYNKVISLYHCFNHTQLSGYGANATHYVSKITETVASVIVLSKTRSNLEPLENATETLLELGSAITEKNRIESDCALLSNVTVQIYIPGNFDEPVMVMTSEDLIDLCKDPSYELAWNIIRDLNIQLKSIPINGSIICDVDDRVSRRLRSFIRVFRLGYNDARELLKWPVVTKIRPYAERLEVFSQNMVQYLSKFAKRFGETVTKYYSNSSQYQSKLNQLMEEWDSSPFSGFRLLAWTDLIIEDLSGIRDIMSQFPTISFTDRSNLTKNSSNCIVALAFFVNTTADDTLLQLQKQYLAGTLDKVLDNDGIRGGRMSVVDRHGSRRDNDNPVYQFVRASIVFLEDATFVFTYEMKPSDKLGEIIIGDSCSDDLANFIM